MFSYFDLSMLCQYRNIQKKTLNIRRYKCYLSSSSLLLNTCFSDKAKKTETLMDVTKTRESLSLSFLIIRSKYLLLSPYRIYPEEFCLSYLCQQDFLYTLQLGALAVLGVSIWILVVHYFAVTSLQSLTL